jgi:hypothetical protein
MEHSKTYYVVRGIARFITYSIITGFVVGGFWLAYMVLWSMS